MNKRTILNQHEVNKQILAKKEAKHSLSEILNPSGRYRDEDYKIYKLKKQQFLDSVKQYSNLNKSTLTSTKQRLDIDGDALIDLDFLYKIDIKPAVLATAGSTIRKRTLRPIFGELGNLIDRPKPLEPWFKRYLVLGKLIKAVRNLILKNRLLKRLAILKRLDKEQIEGLENQGFQVFNVSYPEIFEKFCE